MEFFCNGAKILFQLWHKFLCNHQSLFLGAQAPSSTGDILSQLPIACVIIQIQRHLSIARKNPQCSAVDSARAAWQGLFCPALTI